MKLLSVFGGGLWFIPLALTLGFIYCFIRGYKQSKSGSLESVQGATRESDENVPFWKCPATRYGIGLFIVDVVVVIAMYADK